MCGIYPRSASYKKKDTGYYVDNKRSEKDKPELEDSGHQRLRGCRYFIRNGVEYQGEDCTGHKRPVSRQGQRTIEGHATYMEESCWTRGKLAVLLRRPGHLVRLLVVGFRARDVRGRRNCLTGLYQMGRRMDFGPESAWMQRGLRWVLVLQQACQAAVVRAPRKMEDPHMVEFVRFRTDGVCRSVTGPSL